MLWRAEIAYRDARGHYRTRDALSFHAASPWDAHLVALQHCPDYVAHCASQVTVKRITQHPAYAWPRTACEEYDIVRIFRTSELQN